ncbi:uncharacterized protein SCHCODRAFT_02490513 [Schizophyllum commune H4-8]|nr:uncharacterized protein SCHCODRAFT_02490513 [Schizophyllum commune H4-8]KAI5898514.1 hypothetical protein SCHCODRAFT_02490513 [Schizophyllum commune H4-8]
MDISVIQLSSHTSCIASGLLHVPRLQTRRGAGGPRMAAAPGSVLLDSLLETTYGLAVLRTSDDTRTRLTSGGHCVEVYPRALRWCCGRFGSPPPSSALLSGLKPLVRSTGWVDRVHDGSIPIAYLSIHIHFAHSGVLLVVPSSNTLNASGTTTRSEAPSTTTWPAAPGEESSGVSATVTATSGPASGDSASTRSDGTATSTGASASTSASPTSTSASEIITTSALSTDSSSTSGSLASSAIQSTIIAGSSDPGSSLTEVLASTSISESTFASTRVVYPSSPPSAPASLTTAPLSTTAPSPSSLVAFAKTEESSSASGKSSASTSEDSSSTTASAPPPEMPSDTASEPESSSTESVTSTESEEPASTSTEAPSTTAESTSGNSEPTSTDSEPTSDSTSSSEPTSNSNEATSTTDEAKTTASSSASSSPETVAGKEQVTNTSSADNESSSATESSSTTASATLESTPASDSDSGASETGTAEKAEKTVTSMVDTTVSGHSSSATATRTITDAPDSTLSQVLSVTSTFTNAQGRLVTTVDTPSVITITSTSTGEDGGFVYSTHVVANPTGFGGSGAISEKGFFHNTGAVAGTFTVVGLVAAAAAFLLFWLCRKRRRVQRRRRWMATVDQPPYTPNDRLPYGTSNPNSPFEDPAPQTEEVLPPLTPLTASRAASVRFTDEGPSRPNPSPLLPGPPPFVRPPYVNPGQRMTDLERSEGSPFEDPPVTQMVSVPQMVSVQPLNVTPRYAHVPQAESENNSLAPSSPSIYPDSLSPEDDEHHDSGAEGQGYGNPFDDQPKILSYVVQAPPRPARSHLRRESSKIMSTPLPLTPPDSMNGHSPSASPDHSQQPRIHAQNRSPPF